MLPTAQVRAELHGPSLLQLDPILLQGGARLQEMKEWLTRFFWYLRYRDCHKLAFRIATMGQGEDNGEAQQHLDRAKDELYQAARIFKAWSR